MLSTCSLYKALIRLLIEIKVLSRLGIRAHYYSDTEYGA